MMADPWKPRDDHSNEIANRSLALLDSELLDQKLAAFLQKAANGGASASEAFTDILKKDLYKFRREFRCSTQFVLMRIFFARYGGDNTPENGFTISVGGEPLTFRNITSDHAEDLHGLVEELKKYQLLLRDTAKRKLFLDLQEVPDAVRNAEQEKRWSRACELIDEALECTLTGNGTAEPKPRNEKDPVMPRQDLLELGHYLGLSLAEMNAFLLRSLDFEDGLFYSFSGDLIEAYGFLTQSSAQKVALLKEEYLVQSQAYLKGHQPSGKRDSDMTKRLGAMLPALVSRWPVEKRDSYFMATLLSNSFWLDKPSQTALRIYHNLAKAAYDMICQIEAIEKDRKLSMEAKQSAVKAVLTGDPGRESPHMVYEKIMNILRREDDALESLGEEERKAIADKLISFQSRTTRTTVHSHAGTANAVRTALVPSSIPDRMKSWCAIRLGPDKNLTITWRFGNEGRTRVQDLLLGNCTAKDKDGVSRIYGVQKEDMLSLLWAFFNVYWAYLRPFSAGERLDEFCNAADAVLAAALLPRFYVPHIFEQALLRSILYSAAVTANSRYQSPPAMLQSVRETTVRTRERKPRKGRDEND